MILHLLKFLSTITPFLKKMTGNSWVFFTKRYLTRNLMQIETPLPRTCKILSNFKYCTTQSAL